MIQLKNYINGELLPPVNDNWLDNYEPARGKVYSQIPDSDGDDIALAVKAAKDAFPSWSKTSIEKRHDYLMRIANLIEEKLDMLAEAESRDNGKPLKLATQVDIPRAASNFRFYATAAMQFPSEAHPMAGLAINYTLRQPLGVVGCISPWNLPLYLFSWKIAPALATGNTVIAKPSEVTPVTAYLLSEICIAAGLPKGVLNIVHGLGHKAGAAIVENPEVKAISFTGGTKTGAAIAAQAAPEFKKLSLELGGKNPNIIFADCDFNKMMSTTMLSSFANQGQICLCGSRIYVQRPIYNQFKEEFINRTKALTIGDPADPDTKLGAVVSEAHMEKILSYIALAEEEGGTVLAGGHRVYLKGDLADGWYVEPTIIDGLSAGCRTNQEEIFGPVVTITPFDTEEDALALANGTQYGLSTTIWTEDLTRAHRMAENIHAGIVWINCWLLRDLRTPFGGTKQSGVGREGGFEAMRFFTEPKNVCIKYG
jgi:aminomuconate-semialdehyde/2-hydroxymuconate-6-semialdehyde dehydrogenase